MGVEQSYPSDESVMKLIQSGQLDLLGILYTRHSASVFSLCVRIVPDRDTAEDLVHDSFMRVIRYRQKFRGQSRFSTWLYRIVRNVCLDHIGKRKREYAGIDALIANNACNGDHTQPDASEMSAEVRAFEALRKDQQSILVMSRIDGVGYAELAEFFDASEGATRVRVHRALRDLRQNLADLRRLES